MTSKQRSNFFPDNYSDTQHKLTSRSKLWNKNNLKYWLLFCLAVNKNQNGFSTVQIPFSFLCMWRIFCLCVCLLISETFDTFQVFFCIILLFRGSLFYNINGTAIFKFFSSQCFFSLLLCLCTIFRSNSEAQKNLTSSLMTFFPSNYTLIKSVCFWILISLSIVFICKNTRQSFVYTYKMNDTNVFFCFFIFLASLLLMNKTMAVYMELNFSSFCSVLFCLFYASVSWVRRD